MVVDSLTNWFAAVDVTKTSSISLPPERIMYLYPKLTGFGTASMDTGKERIVTLQLIFHVQQPSFGPRSRTAAGLDTGMIDTRKI